MLDALSVSIETYTWLDWVRLTHQVGLVLAVAGLLLGDGLALRALFRPGPPIPQRLLDAIHATVFCALILLVSSGTALMTTMFDIMALPPKLIFKLGAVVILCTNAVLIDQIALPMMRTVRRPYVAFLSTRDLAMTIAIGALSLATWLSVFAVVFIPPLQALSTLQMFGGLAFIWLSLTGVAFAAALESEPRHAAREAREAAPDPADDPMAFGGAPDFGQPFASLAPRFAEPHPAFASGGAAPARPVNDNPREPAGSKAVLKAARARMGRGRSKQVDAAAPRAATADASADVTPAPSAIADVRASCRSAFVGVALISLITNALMLTGPLFMLQVYDRVLTSKSLPTLFVLFGLALVLLAFLGVLEILRSRVLSRIGLRIDRLLGEQAFLESLKLRDGTTDSERVRLLKDIRHVRRLTGSPAMAALFDLPWSPLFFALLFVFHWQLGALAVAGGLVLVAMSLITDAMSRGSVEKAMVREAETERWLETGTRNAEIVSALGMREPVARRWFDHHASEVLLSTKVADVSSTMSGMIKSARLMLQAAILALGAYLVLGGSITAGVMIAASIIMSRALAPVEQVAGQARNIAAARQGWARLADAFADAPDTDERLDLERPQGALSVSGLYSAPPGMQTPMLKGLQFELAPGDGLGVMGPSGSGKSTLARALVGVWPNMRGSVRLDGAALDHWPATALARHIGYLPQHIELFDGTIAENIARLDPAAPPERIIAAARNADAHDMIQALSDGYNTRVGRGGAVLSGGHRQRIALARALYGEPCMVVLDEPNSNLDTEGEAALSQAILRLRQAGTTVIVIAHRKKGLENLNKVLVLDSGRQAVFGDKREVLQAVAKLQKTPGRRMANAS